MYSSSIRGVKWGIRGLWWVEKRGEGRGRRETVGAGEWHVGTPGRDVFGGTKALRGWIMLTSIIK